VGATFLVLLVAAGVRAAPGALLKPLQDDFGWSRGSISLAVAVSILTYGLGGPIAGSLIDRFGPRRIALGGLVVIAAGLVPLVFLRELWQFFLLWGIVVGVGTGAVSSVLGATVALRWFRERRGMVVGLFAAASSAGQLIFLPSFVTVIAASGWQTAIGAAAVAIVIMTIPAVLFLRDRPSDVGRRPYGDDGSAEHAASERAEAAEGLTVREAIRSADFWLLAGSFFVCGYTSNGLIGTHLISHAVEHGFTEVTAAGAVGVMGMMNVFGTLASGWATDRFDNRKLLAAYYGFRALSITWLPSIDATQWLFLFAIIYGLDWIATVPPTTNLTARLFGRRNLGQIYGWIFFAHMIGAALAAWLGGAVHDWLGDYTAVFLSAGLMGFVAAAMTLRISITGRIARPPASLPPSTLVTPAT
jgi:sugar phosphate permease